MTLSPTQQVNGDVKLGQTPLHFAVSLGKWEAVLAILKDACCLRDDLSFEMQEQNKSTQEAKSKRDQLMLAKKEMLKRQYSILWAKDSQGNNVFHLAVIHNKPDMYQKLRDFAEKLSGTLQEWYIGVKIADDPQLAGSKFNSFNNYDDRFLKNDNNFTPLELAAYLGNVDMMGFLLKTYETETKWTFANDFVELKKVRLIARHDVITALILPANYRVNSLSSSHFFFPRTQVCIRDLDTYKTLVRPRSFKETWIDLKAPEHLEPNLLSIIVTRTKLPFLEGSKFPEFSALLEQKWDIFGKRLMAVWLVMVSVVFVAFQAFIISVVNEVRGVPYADVIQQRLATALYIIAGSFLFLDWMFEYTLGVVQSEEELSSTGPAHNVGSREYPINLLDVDVPPWRFHGEVDNILQMTKFPDTHNGLRALSEYTQNRHSPFAPSGSTVPAVTAPSDQNIWSCISKCLMREKEKEGFALGWDEDLTKLFRQFVGYNYCARSSLSFCSKIYPLYKETVIPLDIVLKNRKQNEGMEENEENPVYASVNAVLSCFYTFIHMLKRLAVCFLGLIDSRGLYSHMWCISVLASGLAAHYENSDIRMSFLALATVFLFLYMLRFYLLFESLGVYMVMIQRMLSTDLAKWLAVAAIYLVSFAEAFILIGTVLSPEQQPGGYFLTQFKWVLGDSTTDGFDTDAKDANPFLYQIAVILFCIFMILLPLTLINMLTGMFGKTCDDYAAQAEAIHRHNRANITLSLERVLYRLPNPILSMLGFRSTLWLGDELVRYARSLFRTLKGENETNPLAPSPSRCIFRYHRASYDRFFKFWPKSYTFVDCRTG
jgi:ankyrin repeat protein